MELGALQGQHAALVADHLNARAALALAQQRCLAKGGPGVHAVQDFAGGANHLARALLDDVELVAHLPLFDDVVPLAEGLLPRRRHDLQQLRLLQLREEFGPAQRHEVPDVADVIQVAQVGHKVGLCHAQHRAVLQANNVRCALGHAAVQQGVAPKAVALNHVPVGQLLAAALHRKGAALNYVERVAQLALAEHVAAGGEWDALQQGHQPVDLLIRQAGQHRHLGQSPEDVQLLAGELEQVAAGGVQHVADELGRGGDRGRVVLLIEGGAFAKGVAGLEFQLRILKACGHGAALDEEHVL
mmetsp:Transcript_26158/g.67628  ORF Transcript_26158/g.67628 Transcript_26158/m.67628 type:complete len:300 (+) Transcript_26158:252-1151(+)